MLYTRSGAWKTRQLQTATVIVTAMVTLACSSSAGDTKSQSAGATAGATDSSRSDAQVARSTAKVPELPRKIEDISPEDFVKAIENVSWSGHAVERECTGAGLEGMCRDTPGHVSTVVRHEAAAGANDVAFGAALPENGVVISRMQNLRDRREKFYGLRGKGEWYAILTRGESDDKAILQLVKLDFSPQGKPKLDLMPGAWQVGKCKDGDGHHDTADAGFKDCNAQANAGAPLVPNSFNRGAWFTCSLGCCTTEGVRGNAGEKGPDSTKTDSTTRDTTKRQQQRPR